MIQKLLENNLNEEGKEDDNSVVKCLKNPVFSDWEERNCQIYHFIKILALMCKLRVMY